MPLTIYDESVLKGRNLLTDYVNNKQQFIQVGKLVYQNLLTHGGTPPNPT